MSPTWTPWRHAYDRSIISAASRGKGEIMARSHHPDALLDRDMCMAELARHFGVTQYRIKEIKEWRLVKFRDSDQYGFPASVARPIDFMDVPMYMIGQAAKLIGLKSARTLRRWREAGYIQLTPSPRFGRLYATPRQLIEARRFKENRVRRSPKPDPEKLIKKLAKRALSDGGPPVDDPRKLWPSDL